MLNVLTESLAVLRLHGRTLCIATALLGVSRYPLFAESWPFEVSFPAGWSVSRLQGITQTPNDQSGVREVAVFEDPDGRSVIGLICAWRRPDQPIDIGQELQLIVDGLNSNLPHGASVDSGPIVDTVVAGRRGKMLRLRTSYGSYTLNVEQIAVAATDRCLVTATLITNEENAFEKRAPIFLDTLKNLRIANETSTALR